jgi:UDP-glucose 4-epimerase
VLRYLRAGGPSVTLNCGYGHGFSVREVTEMVKRVAGVDFKVEVTPRRPGDPAQIVAASDPVRVKLGWSCDVRVRGWRPHRHRGVSVVPTIKA